MTESSFVHAFREAAPYIHYLRGKTLVIGIASTLLQGGTLRTLATDLNLLSSLGVRLVLVHGSDSQINELCSQHKHRTAHCRGRRVTDAAALQFAKQACGQLQFDLQAALSIGFAHSPQRAPKRRIAYGNFVSAQPLGIIDGTDMGYTGQVRKIDHTAIQTCLEQEAIVVISPIAASLSGQSYNLAMSGLAEAVAVAVQAEKLVFLTEHEGLLDHKQNLISALTADEAARLLETRVLPEPQTALVEAAIGALRQGVSRAQILSGRQSGALIQELFTRHGAGTSVAQIPFISIRPATSDDIADIIALIRPLEEQGILLHRSRKYLESHIGDYSVLENDRQIYGCVALKTFPSDPTAAELACLAVSGSIRNSGYGEYLLDHLVKQAAQSGKTRLFALSTRTADWFAERGFQAAAPEDLPAERLAEYRANGRQSKVFVMPIPKAA